MKIFSVKNFCNIIFVFFEISSFDFLVHSFFYYSERKINQHRNSVQLLIMCKFCLEVGLKSTSGLYHVSKQSRVCFASYINNFKVLHILGIDVNAKFHHLCGLVSRHIILYVSKENIS